MSSPVFTVKRTIGFTIPWLASADISQQLIFVTDFVVAKFNLSLR